MVLDNLSTGKRENLNAKAIFVQCDISDYESIKSNFQGVEAVFHAAALARIMPSVKNPLETHRANVTGTLNVLWAAKQAGVKKFIYSASSSVYGDRDPEEYPLKETAEPKVKSPYGMTKLMGEYYCQLFSNLYELPTVILRYFNVYGPRQITEGAYATVIGVFLKQKLEGKPITIVADAGDRLRDFTHVRDVVTANILAWQKDVPPGEIINIGCGKNYSINRVAGLIGGPTEENEARPWEYQMTLADNRKAAAVLGWKPTIDLEAGIREIKKIHGLSHD